MLKHIALWSVIKKKMIYKYIPIGGINLVHT